MSRDIGTWRHSSRRYKLKLVLCHRCHTANSGNFSSPPLACYPETGGGCAVLLWRRQSLVKWKVRLLVCDTAERKIRFVAKWLVESAQVAGCFLPPPPPPPLRFHTRGVCCEFVCGEGKNHPKQAQPVRYREYILYDL